MSGLVGAIRSAVIAVVSVVAVEVARRVTKRHIAAVVAIGRPLKNIARHRPTSQTYRRLA